MNSLQMLSFLLSTLKHRPSDGGGDDAAKYERFEATARRLILGDARYDLNILNQKISNPAEINFSDNDLAFKPYLTLASACGFGGRWPLAQKLEYSSNSTLYELCETIAPAFQASIERAYEIIAPEKQALFAAIYALTSKEGDTERAVTDALETLREYPRDLVFWPTDNSGRLDLTEDKSMLPVISRSREAIPRHQSCALRWCNDPFQFVCGNGMREEDPTFFLEVYWMMTAHGLLKSK